MPQLTDEQLGVALAENGHGDLAEALAEKLAAEQQGGERTPPEDMNAAIRRGAGRGE